MDYSGGHAFRQVTTNDSEIVTRKQKREKLESFGNDIPYCKPLQCLKRYNFSQWLRLFNFVIYIYMFGQMSRFVLWRWHSRSIRHTRDSAVLKWRSLKAIALILSMARHSIGGYQCVSPHSRAIYNHNTAAHPPILRNTGILYGFLGLLGTLCHAVMVSVFRMRTDTLHWSPASCDHHRLWYSMSAG